MSLRSARESVAARILRRNCTVGEINVILSHTVHHHRYLYRYRTQVRTGIRAEKRAKVRHGAWYCALSVYGMVAQQYYLNVVASASEHCQYGTTTTVHITGMIRCECSFDSDSPDFASLR